MVRDLESDAADSAAMEMTTISSLAIELFHSVERQSLDQDLYFVSRRIYSLGISSLFFGNRQSCL